MKSLLLRISMGGLMLAASLPIQAQTRPATLFHIPDGSLAPASGLAGTSGLTIASIIVSYDTFDPCYGCDGAPVSLPYALRYVHTGVGLIIPVQLQDTSYTGPATLNFQLVQNGAVVASETIDANFSPGVSLVSFFAVGPKTAGPADVAVVVSNQGKALVSMSYRIDLF